MNKKRNMIYTNHNIIYRLADKLKIEIEQLELGSKSKC